MAVRSGYQIAAQSWITDFPLVAAVCGGGSAGKSTLFNSLIGRNLSPTGGRAGLNRRVLAAIGDKPLKMDGFLQVLTHSFEGGAHR